MAGNALEQVSGYVLAGGRSSRMGQDKALLMLDGATLLDRAVALLASVCGSVAILSGPEEDHVRAATLSRSGRLVPDRLPNCGPLGGVHAALCDAAPGWVLVLPVDAPFLPAHLLRSWIEACAVAANDASWIHLGPRLQPLPLLLRTGLASPVEAQLQAGNWKLRSGVEAAVGDRNAGRIALYPLPGNAETEIWFANLNTPEDLQVWSSTSAN